MGKDDLGVVRTRLDYEHRLLNSKLSNGRTLLELTEFRGIALWWFVDPGFNEILKTYFWGKENIHNMRQGRSRVRSSLRFVAWFSTLGNDQFLHIIARSLCKKSLAHIEIDAKSKKRILITGEDIEWRRTSDPASGNEIITDQFFKPILDIAKNRPDHYFISTFPLKSPLIWALPPFFRSIEIVKEKNRTWGIPHIPLENYSSIKCSIVRIKAWHHFAKIWKEIEHDPYFLTILESTEVGNISELLGQFRKFFNYDLPEAACRIEIGRRIMENLKPDLTILEEEYGRFERAIVISSRESRIPTLGIQHGIIHEDHKGYMYRKEEIAVDGSIKTTFAPIPDITAVYGEMHRNLLIEKSAYSSDTVEVTGQPRYDRIINIMKSIDPDEIKDEIPVPTGKKMILMVMAFNGLPDEENRHYLSVILQAIKDTPEAFLVIKQHPGETESHRRMILDKMAEINAPAILVPKSSDTLKLIWASDLVLTRFSTTGLEAIAFNKTLIVMNLSGQPDPVDYVIKGVAKGVYHATDLRPAIEESFITGVKATLQNRESYIIDNLHKMDGNSAQRVYALIDKMLSIPRK
ncbi:MAG: hypothetical protein NTY03_04830 [Candidatus Bathyarchaeota archaeon]|nr:hypothetical protein [Candidatus Bathyarchaeota archaeon]